ncbi:MAG TPA: LapA family protein [Microthrixaceae bacterium]|nr:LapA family protein [Microthrixaceae bacterium]
MSYVPPEEQPSGRRLGAGAIGTLVGVGVLGIFMIQNTDETELKFLFWTFEWPLWLVTLVSALFGALVWFGIGVLRRRARRKERRDDRRD